MKIKPLHRWVITGLWMLLIFIGSSIPSREFPSGPEYASVVIHFVEFFLLCSLLIWSINAGFNRPVILLVFIASLSLTLLYAATDEIHQLFVPGRVSDLMDFLVDSAGAVTACLVIFLSVNVIRNQYINK